MTQDVLNTVIIGSGPAGWTSAIYTCRSGLSPVLLSGPEPGGQLTTTPEIGNWPGRKDAPDGFSLMQTLQEHAVSLGTKMVSDTVTKVDFSGEIKELTLSSGEVLKTKTVIIATGAKAKYLGLPSEETYKGKGISACATCDGFFFRNKEVAVVGGGSAAFVEALYLTNMCKKVYLIHRREGFRSEKVMVDKLRSMVDSGKVEFILNAQITEFKGDGSKLTGIELDVKGQKKDLALDGVFVAIGHAPATSIFEGQLELEDGYIKTGFGSATATSAKGVFAAGDCADRIYRQAITSAGEGCKAALDVEKYLLG
ncbi:thioredoxin reductase (NADPH) [Succinivibrio dextrinosolvens]|uniref:thioredoxin-disulfide reductase n=1 Tax=Succinivibrio dextrinosolvens TaxID=83771 RepID=UPI0008E97A15|nr:thioredoxin-disulfide reductase [Succinivibrio dextrinosolvens]SFS77959.1 thioredoxin reductase (NADPH) [Succinivibrio dextrinosolvens]